MWLKSYLKSDHDRPLWAFAADELIALNILADDRAVIDKDLRLHVFLQSWHSNACTCPLPKDLADMMKAALDRDVQLEGLSFKREVQRQLPIWYHIKSRARDRGVFNNGQEVKCLKEQHHVISVGDAETLAKRLETNLHRHRRNCACDACKLTRDESPGCLSPHKCYTKARNLLNTLQDKWNPLKPHPGDEPAPDTPERPITEEETLFDPLPADTNKLEDAYRIFCNKERGSQSPPNLDRLVEPDEEEVVVYTDGSAINNGQANARAGAGIFYGSDDIRNRAIQVPPELRQTNQVGEILAVIAAVEDNPKDVPLKIYSD
ncbi:hypothetical protein C8F01DRAFT_918561, partial [Mycena amicta]